MTPSQQVLRAGRRLGAEAPVGPKLSGPADSKYAVPSGLTCARPLPCQVCLFQCMHHHEACAQVMVMELCPGGDLHLGESCFDFRVLKIAAFPRCACLLHGGSFVLHCAGACACMFSCADLRLCLCADSLQAERIHQHVMIARGLISSPTVWLNWSLR